MRRPFWVYPLLLLLLIEAYQAVNGGLKLILDPTGGAFHMTTAMLASTPFPNFLIPGLLLFFFLGLYPVIVAYGLLLKKPFPLLETFNAYKTQHWAYTHSLYAGLSMIIWVDSEQLMLNHYIFLQPLISFIGVGILLLTLLPSMREYYRKK